MKRSRYIAFAFSLSLVLLSFCVIRTILAPHPADTISTSPPSLLGLAGYSLLIGGQQGAWGEANQSPKLVQLSLEDYSSMSLPPPASSGSVWFGAGRLNGSEWLISGWGTDDNGNNPYLFTYTVGNLTGKSLGKFLDHPAWGGGDVFAISYNGTAWMLSGMGTGPDVTPGSLFSHNRMTLGVFNETSGFKDLTSMIPHEQLGILYTNAWSGKYWLIGGGYLPRNIHPGFGVLFTYDGRTISDLTEKITKAVPTFGSVQRVFWNSRDSVWMIGGYNFLAEYDGTKFTDLTPQLKQALATRVIEAVNVVRWNGTAWMLAGGMPKGFVSLSSAWVATYKDGQFTDLSAHLPPEIRLSKYASLLTIGLASNGLWAIGGYADNHAVLLLYTGRTGFVNLSPLVNMTYVTWVRIVTA